MSRRCILVGMDGANPRFVLRLVAQGRLPNFGRMMEEGVFAPHCLSSLPTSTPENWTTIATGAWNGTHQVMSFQKFRPPELHGRWMAGYSSEESEAEFVWDAVERAGGCSILLKYPASWPPTMRTGVQVCGCHVRPCLHQIDGAHLFSTVEPRNAPLVLRPRPELAGPLGSKLPPLAGEMAFEARGLGGEDSEDVSLSTPVCKLAPPGKVYHLFVISTGSGYDRAVVARDGTGRERIAVLPPGGWSEWLLESFETVDGTREGTLRFKLEELSPDGRVVKVYATQIMDVDHYTFPESAGRELYENVGPFITDIGWEGLGHDRSRAWFGESVMAELADHQHRWLAGAVRYLTGTLDWTLCMLQAHCIDCANHHCLDVADPEANPEDRALGDRYLGFIEGLYESLDRMLGEIMDAVGEDTCIFVVSDHGGLPGHMRIDVRSVLEEAGLLVLDGRGEVDWEKTRAYPSGSIFVNVNLEGREPRGTVPPELYDRTCDEIIAALHAYRDPETGLHPFNLALRRVDMRYLGLYGRKVGDVVFTLREPFGGTHGSQLSTAEWGISSNTSLLIMRGPGIRRGVELERTVWLTDVVPTMCHLMGVPVPHHAEGAVIYQALEEFA